MSQEDTTLVHPDALELAELLRPSWAIIDANLRSSGVPLNEGEAGGEGEGEGGEGAEPTGDEGSEPKTFDADYVKKLRSEAAGHRKDAREAQAKLRQLEEQGLSETEKLKKAAEDGTKLSEAGTRKLRQANLIVALSEKGLSGGRAKAASKLLDGIEFDDDDEPKNLDAALKAAAATYGDELFGGQQNRTTFDGGARTPARGAGGMDAAIRAAAGR
jgi:hypothetical protein